MSLPLDSRYNKCVAVGMKRDAVQEERQRSKSDKSTGDDIDGENSNLGPGDMPAERILEAERGSDKLELDHLAAETDIQTKFKFAGEKQLTSLVEWAKHIPHFTELCIEDQVMPQVLPSVMQYLR